MSEFESSSSQTALPIFVYASDYNMDLGAHVFPSIKYGYVYLRLVDDPRYQYHRFMEPGPLTPEQAALVHSREYIDDLLSLRNSSRLSHSELPLTAPIVESFFLASGGTLLAGRLALKHGMAVNLSGGFHHAFSDRAEGFCYLNDLAIAIRVLQEEGLIRRALIIDLDVHQGNGSARIFQNDRDVFTFSIHEQMNYPIKEESDLDIPLEQGCRDEEYLTLLSRALKTIRERFEPDIIFYQAGVDPYEGDMLGGAALTRNGMAERDRMVRDYRPDLPLVTVLGGGYAQDSDDTVSLHLQTCDILAGHL